jgi:hypothetical protein
MLGGSQLDTITILSEYKVDKEQRGTYLNLIHELKDQLHHFGAEHITIYEGTDQADLFVEQFEVANMEIYLEIKQTRKNEQSAFWQKFNGCILGGKDKLHMWAFNKVK